MIDDARSHLPLLKMLRQFHFIDQNGKDQGVNVRNRSKELAELLSDVERIRAERKKARNNRNKFGGVEGSAMGGGLSSSSKYGGFGSEDSASYGGYSGGVYGDGGGYGGNASGFQDSSSRKDQFEEYDEFDDGAMTASARRKTEGSSASATKREPKKAEPLKKKEPEIDILGFDDVPPETPPKEISSNGKKAVPNAIDDAFGPIQSGAVDDDFDDFQTAAPVTQPSKPSIPGFPPPLLPTSKAQLAAPKPVLGSQGASLNDLVGFNSISPTPRINSVTSMPQSSFTSPPATIQQQPPRPTGYQATQPNYFTSVAIPSATPQTSTTSGGFTSPLSNPSTKPTPKPASSGGDAFGSLWSTASAGAGIKKTSIPANQGPNLASLAKEKASAGIWGVSASGTGTSLQSRPAASGGSGQRPGGGLDDLLG